MWFQNAGWFFLLGSGSDTGHTECLGTFALSLLFQDLQLLTKCCYGVLQISFSYQVGIADSHWVAKLSLVSGQTSQAVPSVRRPSRCAACCSVPQAAAQRPARDWNLCWRIRFFRSPSLQSPGFVLRHCIPNHLTGYLSLSTAWAFFFSDFLVHLLSVHTRSISSSILYFVHPYF